MLKIILLAIISLLSFTLLDANAQSSDLHVDDVVYVAGFYSHNAFKIISDGIITEIIDSTDYIELH